MVRLPPGLISRRPEALAAGKGRRSGDRCRNDEGHADLIWINLVAGVAAVVAAARAWRMLARRRGLRREVEASCIVRWQQPSPSGRGAAPRLWFVILGHGLSVIIVCVLLLGSLNRAAPGPLSTRFETPTGRWLAAIVGFDDPQLNSIG